MQAHAQKRFLSRKWVLAAVGLPVLIAAWWAFRPEKLWINQKVNEPAPFASASDSQPIYTGKLKGEAHQTSGRATVYQAPDGKLYVRLTDFSTSNGPDVHVILVHSDEKAADGNFALGELERVDLGSLKGNQGDQNYGLPAATDLNKYNAVMILCQRFHAVFGVARLERF
jgi:hypothetical protein